MNKKDFLILAIDDDRNMLKLMQAQIESFGYKIITAITGQEGVDLARSGDPDLILLDIMMPGIDGFKVIKMLRQDEVTTKTPIIMITSKTNKEDVVLAMRLGVIDYIVKPYEVNSFQKKIESALNISQSVREEDERNQQITIIRNAGITTITPRMSLSSKTFLDEARQVFNTSFLMMVKKDTMVIDLRVIPEFTEKDIKSIEVMISLLGNEKMNFIAGKHYGDIVALTDIDDKHNLFISQGDFEVFINK